MLQNAGFTIRSHRLRCYVLMGFEGDTLSAADARCWQTVDAGFMPLAMLFDEARQPMQWHHFQREWADATIIGHKMRNRGKGLPLLPEKTPAERAGVEEGVA